MESRNYLKKHNVSANYNFTRYLLEELSLYNLTIKPIFAYTDYLPIKDFAGWYRMKHIYDKINLIVRKITGKLLLANNALLANQIDVCLLIIAF